MTSKRAAFVIALVLSLAALLGLAWAANVEDELKKLETDRAAAVVKGDVARKANFRRLHADQRLWPNVRQVGNGRRIQIRQNQAHLRRAFRYEAARLWQHRSDYRQGHRQGNHGRKGCGRADPVHPRLCEERRQLAIRRLPTNPCRERITAETLGQPQLAPSLLFGIPRAGWTPSSAIFAWRTVRLHPWEVRVGADVSSAHAERSSAAPCGLLGGQSRLGKGSTAQDAIGKGMTFTRARHNPLSLVILNERRFCASEGPRRAARCLAFFARQYSRVWHTSL